MNLLRWANLKIVLVSLLMLGALAATALVFWSTDVPGPTADALEAYQTDSHSNQ